MKRETYIVGYDSRINLLQRNMKQLCAIIFTVLLRFTVGEEQEASCANIGMVSRVQEVQGDFHVTVEYIVIPIMWMVDGILLLICLIIICSIIYFILYIDLDELDVVDIETIDI